MNLVSQCVAGMQQMQKRLKNVDGIIEVHDARISFHDNMHVQSEWQLSALERK